MKVITYDVGTTGFKAALYELAEKNIKLLASEVDHYVLNTLPNNGVEQNPEDWWQAMCRTTKKLIEGSGIAKEEVEGISFCSQFATLVMVDKDGNALRPAMNTMDCRASEQYKRYMGSGISVMGMNVRKLLKCLKITKAAPVSTKDTVYRYLWVRDNEPEIFKKTYKWLDAKEYLAFRATGQVAASRDDAYMTFLYNPKTRNWSEELCRLFDVDMKHLPELCEATDIVGRLQEGPAAELGLAPGTAVISGGSDVSLCQVGAGCLAPGDVCVCSGTSGWVCTTTDEMAVDVSHSIAAIVGSDPDTYLYTADCETAGKCIEWGKERLSATPIKTFGELIDMIKGVPAGSNGIIFSPWMHGNRCPFEDENARGVFFNVDIDNRSSDLVKAVVEGVCYHMRWLYETSAEKVKVSDTVRFVGGSAMSKTVAQVLADVMNKTVEIVEEPRQAGTSGAAALCGVAFGIIPSMAAIKDCIKVETVLKPYPANVRVYDKLFPVFKDLYKDNKKSFEIINTHLKELQKGLTEGLAE